jgi:hypothetical protein
MHQMMTLVNCLKEDFQRELLYSPDVLEDLFAVSYLGCRSLEGGLHTYVARMHAQQGVGAPFPFSRLLGPLANSGMVIARQTASGNLFSGSQHCAYVVAVATYTIC